jgi:hypothetical protein
MRIDARTNESNEQWNHVVLLCKWAGVVCWCLGALLCLPLNELASIVLCSGNTHIYKV